MAGGEYDLLSESAAESVKESTHSFANIDEPKSAALRPTGTKQDCGLATLQNQLELLSEQLGKGSVTDASATVTNA